MPKSLIVSLTIMVITGVFTASAACQASLNKGQQKDLTAIKAGAFSDGRTIESVRHLADMIGPRLSGSDSYRLASAWAIQEFQQVGLSEIHVEPVVMSTWEPRQRAIVHMLQPRQQEMHAFSIGWTPSIHISSEPLIVLHGPDGNPHLDDRSLNASVVLLDCGIDNLATYHILDKLKERGVSGVLIEGGGNGMEVDGSATHDGRPAALPVEEVGEEDFKLLTRLATHDTVEVSVSAENRIAEQASADNVIADLKGVDSTKYLIVGAHLDSWVAGTGAQDNATGVAEVMETARLLKELGHPPKISIRFILFGGEEEGLLGSQAYVREHSKDLKDCQGVLITDTGSGRVLGWHLLGRSDSMTAVTAINDSLQDIGPFASDQGLNLVTASDHYPFLFKGIPALLLWTDLSDYYVLHHRSHDVLDTVNLTYLDQASTLIASAVYMISNKVVSLGPGLTGEALVSWRESVGPEGEVTR